MEKSMLDVACDYLTAKEGKASFYDIWNYVCKELDFTPTIANEKVSRFYANLSLDGRFVNAGDNFWNLRSRVKFDDVHIDMKEVYSELGSDSDDTDSEDTAAEDLKEELASTGIVQDESDETGESKDEENPDSEF